MCTFKPSQLGLQSDFGAKNCTPRRDISSSIFLDRFQRVIALFFDTFAFLANNTSFQGVAPQTRRRRKTRRAHRSYRNLFFTLVTWPTVHERTRTRRSIEGTHRVSRKCHTTHVWRRASRAAIHMGGRRASRAALPDVCFLYVV